MARKPNEGYREAKRGRILDAARLVFCRKGYLNVTMQDIIDECKISRGGIYLYFSSVDEIFREVAARRNREKFDAIRKAVDNNRPFEDVLGEYMTLQKERLMHMESSLLRAMYEYIFSGVEGVTQEFRDAQLDNLRKSMRAVLELGVRQKTIYDIDIDKLTDHFIVVIEGLGILALSEVLTEAIIDGQLDMLNNAIKG